MEYTPPVEYIDHHDEKRSKEVGLIRALQADAILGVLRKKHVPKHGASIWYYVGGLTMVAFTIQFLTGIMLLIYFEPSSQLASKSLAMIVKQVPYGWLVRSLHSWSANIAIFLAFVHMCSTYFMKAYRAPGTVIWISGVLLMALLLGFGYTGYLLPQLHGIALRRFFALHVAVLPLTALILMSLHVVLAGFLSSSIPMGAKVRGWTKFFPDYVLGETIVWLVGFAVILAIAWIFPWEFNGTPYVPKGASTIGIRSDWYLLALLDMQQLLPGWIGILCLAVIAMFWAAVPILDRKSRRNEKSPIFTIIGAALIVLLTAATTLAYFSVAQEKSNSSAGQPTHTAAPAAGQSNENINGAAQAH